MTATRRLFLRFLGLIYLIAFVSLGSQILGLVGSGGILPAAPFLEAVHRELGTAAYWNVPTLFWLDSSDRALVFLCGAGAVLSVVLIFLRAPAACLIVLYLAYLSFVSVCRDFLSFQWDVLLLETGFLAIFFAPLRRGRGPDAGDNPPQIIRALFWWLAFRLYFFSGAVKLMSADPSWRTLTALNYHYWTQPLPPWTAWYMQQLPAWFQKQSTAAMFVIELAVPFLIFAPRRIRLGACAVMATLQFLIMATGNYCFFNLLTLAVFLLLLDDAVWKKPAPPSAEARPETRKAIEWPRWVLIPVAAVLLTLSGFQSLHRLGIDVPAPGPVAALRRTIAPFSVVNGYGLFAVMTTSRPEIILEGSEDRVQWREYSFKYKPGDPDRKPRFVWPHQPRLDWQMWFAALGNYRRNPWFVSFCRKILEGSPEVLKLMDKNPFPEHPPRYLRASVYEYEFTNARERKEKGAWWKRSYKGLYIPVLSLRSH